MFNHRFAQHFGCWCGLQRLQHPAEFESAVLNASDSNFVLVWNLNTRLKKYTMHCNAIYSTKTLYFYLCTVQTLSLVVIWSKGLVQIKAWVPLWCLIDNNFTLINYSTNYTSKADGGGGGDFFLACEDFWRMLDHSFSTCAFFSSFFFWSGD